ncbi:hypothetical protein [Pelagibacterium halotolerans]|uniref:hypothetical protein n=1 Tax=Pelagibacterium halotolerans TaxID=531813 RepID=UPI00089C8DDA|nr:hypothetical protein [Pelagibacterium halotolerans]SEA83674.1 hypothetical protein SAMN05428936_10936 [Pelagibacterium halotolerans]
MALSTPLQGAVLTQRKNADTDLHMPVLDVIWPSRAFFAIWTLLSITVCPWVPTPDAVGPSTSHSLVQRDQSRWLKITSINIIGPGRIGCAKQ